MEHTTIAVDLAKSVFQVAVSRKPGRVDAERRLSRDRFLEYFVQQPPATVLLEACGSAHHWVRQLQQQGHTVRLLPAHDVHRYVRRNKTDRTDAKALLEADRNDDIHAVPVKTIEHQAIASLHRLRSTWQATRTARLNTVRGPLREFGLVIPVGAEHVVPRVRELLADSTTVPDLIRTSLASACDEDAAAAVQLGTRTTDNPGVGHFVLPGALHRAQLDDGAPVGPARGHADNSAGLQGRSHRLAPRVRISMMARSETLHWNRGRRYVSSLIRCR